MRCPDDSDQSGKVWIQVLDSDPVTQQLFYWCTKGKLAAEYHTVRNVDPDADAGSVVRCCVVPRLSTVPVQGRTRGSGLRSWIRVSILKLRTASFNKAKIVKNMNGSTEGRRGSNFFTKYHSKNFSKAVGWDANPDPDPSKKLIEMQNANNSESGRGPYPRIIPKAMWMHTDSDSWGRFQEFLCRPQICIESVRYGPPSPDLIGLQALLM